MLTFLDDLRYGLRTLKKQPATAAIAVLTFTLGIGLTASMFCIVHGALRDLPFEEAENLMHLERSNLSEGIDSMEVTYHDFLAWQERQTTFEGLGACYEGTANLASPGQPPERYDGAFITANAFRILRTDAALGRTLAEDEEGADAPAVVVLGWHVWQNRFAGDPDIVGQTVTLNSRPTEIVGVMPEGFRFPYDQDLWLPLPLDTAEIERGEGITLEVFGRLQADTDLDRAAQDIALIADQLAQEYPETNEGVGSIVKPYTYEYIPREVRAVLFTMLGGVLGVLLIACVNVANLLLSRTVQRSKEVAVRSALGASRFRVVSQLLTETLVLASVGAALGLGLTYLGMEVFTQVIESTSPPYWIDFRVDPMVLVFTIGVSMLAALGAGLLPALQASGEKVGDVLKDETRGSSGFRLGRFSRGLVMTEIALTCGLLAGAGLMIQTVVNLRVLEWGFPTEEVFVARVGLFEEDYPEPQDRHRFFEDLQTRLEALPGVESAALTQSLPGLSSGWSRFEVDGETYPRPEDRPLAHHIIVTPGFFETFRVSPLQGRSFGLQDREDSQQVALVNEDFVATFFPEGEALGQRIRVAGGDDETEEWRTIVGVVPSMYVSGVENEDPQGFYVPLAQTDARFLSMAVLASGGDPLALAPSVRQAVQSLDPNLPIYWVDTLAESIRQSQTWFYDVFGTLFMILGFAALFLAVVGLYGVMSFAVTHRTHEVGIRMALGAKAQDVLRMILRQGAIQVTVGLVLGLILAFGFAWLLQLILFGVTPWDPITYVAIAAILATSGMTACWLPARRAARVDPMVALRQ